MTKTEVMILYSKALFMQSLLSQLMTVTQTKNIGVILFLFSTPIFHPSAYIPSIVSIYPESSIFKIYLNLTNDH